MTLNPNTRLYLASASPRRHEILKQLLIPHQVLQVPPQAGSDEPQLDGEPADLYVRRTARDKVVHAVRWLTRQGTAADAMTLSTTAATPDTPDTLSDDIVILCADTVVILDGLVLGKPLDYDDAARTLCFLSGRTHQVHTAVAVQRAGTLFESVSISEVSFKVLTSSEIEAYCKIGDGMGKAGAYGIQGPAAAFVTRLSGSYTGVMGLPAYETLELLKTAHYVHSYTVKP